MATKRFTGFLRNPLSEYANHDLWRFTHSTTTGEVPKGSSSIFKVDETGYYDITIQYGTVMIESKDRLSQRWINHGQYTISSATTVTTLPALLLATTPMTPELQQELEAILADAQDARDQTVELFDSVDGDFIYHNKNAVGPVSQSDGVPTGAIIQRGSNANGEFVRYADGTQICTNRRVMDYVESPLTIGWPSVFSAAPISCINHETTATFSQRFTRITGITASGADVIMGGTEGSAGTFSYIAIGRWF